MAIQVNIDGVNKTVVQPKVNIDGTWRTVNKVQNNIDGVWKTSFELLTVKIYRYGSLYQTLTVVKGKSVTLPSLGIGFATSSGSTTVSYNSGATITPTGNMNLYAVFSYSIKLYKYGSLYQTLTSKSQSSTGSFTLPTCTTDDGDTFYGWTTTAGSTTRNYTSGQTVSTSGMTLYAIFSYSEATITYTTGTVSSVTTGINANTFTTGATGDVLITGVHTTVVVSNSVGNVSYGSITLGSNGASVKIDNTSVSGILSTKQQGVIESSVTVSDVKSGAVISVTVPKGSAAGTTNGNVGTGTTESYSISVKYPSSSTSTTKYRSTK